MMASDKKGNMINVEIMSDYIKNVGWILCYLKIEFNNVQRKEN